MPEHERLFFIVGTGRCGTTLLQGMLASHPRLYVPPEMRYFGRHDPAVRFHDPLRDDEVAPYLAAFDEDIWWQDMGLDRAAFDAAVRGGLRGSADIYRWVLAHVAAARGATQPRLGEKTPYYASFTDRILALFPDAQFIHLYRDPRDVTASYLGQYWCRAGTALRCAGYIKHVFACMEKFEQRVGPRQFCAVRYETLVAQPETELRRICAFLGEPYDPAMLRFGERADPGFLAVEAEWKGLTREALTDSRIGRHAGRLTPRQIWTVERLLGPMLGRFGYAPAAGDRPGWFWPAAFWAERIYRKLLRTAGLGRPLLDERAVLDRRNALRAAEPQRPA